MILVYNVLYFLIYLYFLDLLNIGVSERKDNSNVLETNLSMHASEVQKNENNNENILFVKNKYKIKKGFGILKSTNTERVQRFQVISCIYI